MSLDVRAVIVVLTSIGLVACAGSAPPSQPVDGTDVGRSSHSSSITYRDRPVSVIENSLPKISVKQDPRLGSQSAKIGVIEFSDYQCSYCRHFHFEQFAQIKKEYIDTGVVQFIHKDLPLKMHAQAVSAAMAAHCAGAQDRFWEMHEALFVHQERLGPSLYAELARQLNLSEPRFKACVESNAAGKDIGQDVRLAWILGLTGTPSFLIGTIEDDMLTIVRQARGAPDFGLFVKEIEKLRQATP